MYIKTMGRVTPAFQQGKAAVIPAAGNDRRAAINNVKYRLERMKELFSQIQEIRRNNPPEPDDDTGEPGLTADGNRPQLDPVP